MKNNQEHSYLQSNAGQFVVYSERVESLSAAMASSGTPIIPQSEFRNLK
jgi:hypothetical protein